MITGVDDLRGGLNHLVDIVADGGALFEGAAASIISAAATHIHTRSGDTKASLTTTPTTHGIQITAGGDRAPHAIWHNYGARSFPGTHFLAPTTQDTDAKVAAQAQTNIDDVIRRHLKD